MYTFNMDNAELQCAIDRAAEHYLNLKAKSSSVDHASRDAMADHLAALIHCQHERAKMVVAANPD